MDEARQAALMGEMEKAESAYQKLQQEQPESYDAHGELGNLYLMQGKEKEAAESYYQAALRLNRAGHRDDAVRLQRVVSRLDEELGAKLEQALKE
jgi:predicted negative regulator of RcsB-dependent stress response